MWEIADGKGELQADEAHVLRMIAAGLPSTMMVRRVGEDVWRDIRSHAPFAMALQRQAQPQPYTQAPAPLAPHQPPGEATLYQDHDVVVTSARAMFNGTTYAVSNITSVRQWTEPKPAFAILLAILFGCVTLIGVATGSAAGALAGTAFGLLPAICFACIHAYVLREKHWVLLMTSGAEARAFWSPDPARAGQVLAALNHAIVRRG